MEGEAGRLSIRAITWIRTGLTGAEAAAAAGPEKMARTGLTGAEAAAAAGQRRWLDRSTFLGNRRH